MSSPGKFRYVHEDELPSDWTDDVFVGENDEHVDADGNLLECER